MQLAVFLLTPILVYSVLLSYLLKKWRLWKLYKPSIDIMGDSNPDRKIVFYLSSLLVGLVTISFMLPIAIIAFVPSLMF